MEPNKSSSIGKRLWHMLRVVYYMIRKGITKHKLIADLHLLLKGGKIAGKALGNLLHHHDTTSTTTPGFNYSAFSCRYIDPTMSFYNPSGREVEFSCSNTPSFPLAAATKRKNRHHLKFDAKDVAKAFEILNSESVYPVMVLSPSPLSVFNLGKSPMGMRQLRITDSPFPVESPAPDGRVDNEAEEFISRFYEQLRLQPRIAATPDYGYTARRSPVELEQCMGERFGDSSSYLG